MMSNIPLKCLLGAFAVVSITGCDATADRDATDLMNRGSATNPEDVANKGFCQKTDKGYEICIKEENIICDDSYCKASGISKDLTGKEKHWINSSYAIDEGEVWCGEGKYEDEDSKRITCGAASHFGMVKKD